MNWAVDLMDVLDLRLRGYSQSALFWAARRFGATRRGIVRNCAIAMVALPIVATFSVFTAKDASIATWLVFILMHSLINAYFAAVAYVRGLRLVERNEQWGSYTNWEEWRWLRWLELFLLPPGSILTSAEILGGDFWSGALFPRFAAIMIMLYALSLPEFPPRERKAAKSAAIAGAGAH